MDTMADTCASPSSGPMGGVNYRIKGALLTRRLISARKTVLWSLPRLSWPYLELTSKQLEWNFPPNTHHVIK